VQLPLVDSPRHPVFAHGRVLSTAEACRQPSRAPRPVGHAAGHSRGQQAAWAGRGAEPRADGAPHGAAVAPPREIGPVRTA
jgi:hypothetical protein